MRSITLLAILGLLLVGPASGRPDSAAPRPNRQEGPTPWLVGGSGGPAKAAVDTVILYGGPGTWEGKFENGGGADWQGWTHRDLHVSPIPYWQVSTYYAANLAGHGPGNQAMYCGDPDLPACTPTDSVGGVTSSMWDELGWSAPVPDPGQAVQVDLTAFLNHDLADAGWDFLELWLHRSSGQEMLAQWTGTADNVFVEQTATVLPEDFTGPGNDEVELVLRVWSDGGWDDRDCLSPSHGACQIDDITVSFDGQPVSFDDFEAGSPVHWHVRDTGSVGDFAALRNNLDDLDSCRSNSSYQVAFIDDGEVVPGTGGTPCQTWCYGPGGWILNNDGGLLADDTRDWFLENQIESPPIPWQPGLDAGLLSFDVYRHEELCATCPGIFYQWHVRSTASADPTDLELAPWKDNNFVFYGTPQYVRHDELIAHLLVEDPRWVQIALEVNEMGWVWGFTGTNGTPAPYFDNVALRGWAAQGPEIKVLEYANFGDAYPEQGFLAADDPGANWCRVDMAQEVNIYQWSGLAVEYGDSMVAVVTSPRRNAVAQEPPRLHWLLAANPAFDEVRPVAPGEDGLLRGSLPGRAVFTGTYPVPNTWSFDLPDTGWFYPGDVLHYYITAWDEEAGDQRFSVWPADTTAVLDFAAGSLYPSTGTVRALPAVTRPAAGIFTQPPMLVVDDAGNEDHTRRLRQVLNELGFTEGVDHDLVSVRGVSSDRGQGLMKVPTDLLDSYQTLLYTSGERGFATLTGNERYAPSDVDAVLGWLAGGGRRAAFLGEGLPWDLTQNDPGDLLLDELGVTVAGRNVAALLGGVVDLEVQALPGNPVIPADARWTVRSRCDAGSLISAVTAGPAALTLAALAPSGAVGSPYAAVIARHDPVLDNRTVLAPLALENVLSPAEGYPDGVAMSGRSYLMRELLDWLGAQGTGFSPTPAADRFAVGVHPNPFNPRTEISFTMPRAGNLSLKIYDLKGRLVRTLAQGRREAGPGSEVWGGVDAAGARVPSGVYFYEARTAGEVLVGKVTLLK